MIASMKQRGAALLVALVMLLVVTIVALSSMQSSLLQERMSANVRDHQLAFQAAEAALRLGELARAGDPGFIGLPVGQVPPPRVETPPPAFWGSASVVTVAGVARAPRFVTEEMAFDSDGETAMIRVTAIGFGAREETQVVLQSIVGI